MMCECVLFIKCMHVCAHTYPGAYTPTPTPTPTHDIHVHLLSSHLLSSHFMSHQSKRLFVLYFFGVKFPIQLPCVLFQTQFIHHNIVVTHTFTQQSSTLQWCTHDVFVADVIYPPTCDAKTQFTDQGSLVCFYIPRHMHSAHYGQPKVW